MAFFRKRRWEWLLCLAGALLLAHICISKIEHRFLPAAQAVFSQKVSNALTHQIARSLQEDFLDGVSYEDLVALERLENGSVAAITTRVGAMNRIKGEVAERVSALVAEMEPADFQVPVGSLTQTSLFSGRGFSLGLSALTAGNTQVQFRQDFSQAGINQTRHQIRLEITVPVELLLAGEHWTETVQTELLLAETVIVGAVPDTYLQIDGQRQSAEGAQEEE